jgi:hypothetical protein
MKKKASRSELEARIVELETALHKRPDAKQVARNLSDFVNCMGNKVEDIVVALDDEHRTLQQGITKFCVAWLEHCAKMHDSNCFDLRNQASCELGKTFVEKIEPRKRAMPFI